MTRSREKVKREGEYSPSPTPKRKEIAREKEGEQTADAADDRLLREGKWNAVSGAGEKEKRKKKSSSTCFIPSPGGKEGRAKTSVWAADERKAFVRYFRLCLEKKKKGF